MRHIRPVLLAFLVVAAVPATLPVAAAVSTDVGEPDGLETQVVREVPNTSNYLDVEESAVRRGDHGTASLDVGATLDRESARLRSGYNRRAFAARYATADNESERLAVLRDAAVRLELRIDELQTRQREALQQYNEGQLSAAGLLVELAAVDTGAREVSRQFQSLRQIGGLALTDDLDDRIQTLETDLFALRGPARIRAGAAMAGERPPLSTYALTSDDAVVLSTTDDRRTFREAYLPANRDPTGTNQFVDEGDPSGITTASDRAIALYPWAYADAGPSLQRLGRSSVYRVTLDHSQGQLETYLDGTTGSVFREYQRLQVDRLPVQSVATNATGDLELRVNRTYATGPMQIRVLDATDDPVDATVTVNGHPAGATGADGRLWTTTPHDQVRVVAETDDGRITVSFVAN